MEPVITAYKQSCTIVISNDLLHDGEWTSEEWEAHLVKLRQDRIRMDNDPTVSRWQKGWQTRRIQRAEVGKAFVLAGGFEGYLVRSLGKRA